MKCPYCGSNLGLEDEYCPYCGKRNLLAEKHQKEMKRYQQEFSKTKRAVYEKSSRFASLTVPLIILFVLFILNIGGIIFAASGWNIGTSVMKKQISADKETHQKNLEQYAAEGDFYGLSGYYNANSLYFSDEFDEYMAVVYAGEAYYAVYNLLMNPLMGDAYAFDEENLSSTVRTITNNLDEIFNIEQNYSYNKEKYLAEDKMELIEAMQEQIKAILVTYGGLSRQEADELPNLSATRQQELLERRLAEK